MNVIERLKNEEQFLTAHYDLVTEEYTEIENAPRGGHDFPNVRLKTALMLLRCEIRMHRDEIRHLIAAYERIRELEQQATEKAKSEDEQKSLSADLADEIPLPSDDVTEKNQNKSEQPKKRTGKRPEYIFQYDSNLNLVGKYESAKEAAGAAGISYPSSIRKVVCGINLSAGGYFWSKGHGPLKKFPDKWVELSQKKKNN